MITHLEKEGSLQMNTAADKKVRKAKQNQIYYKPIKSFFSPIQLMENRREKLQTHISGFRQSEIIQMRYIRSPSGDSGVYFDPENHARPVVKIGGYSEISPLLDRIAGHFGLGHPNSRIVFKGEEEWSQVEEALLEAAPRALEGLEEALLMNFIEGNDLHEDGVYGKKLEDVVDPVKHERHRKVLYDMGKLLVMDLLTRNDDRFPLSIDEIKNESERSNASNSSSNYAWRGNEENIRIGAEGQVSAIDSAFTEADNEENYARIVAEYLTNPDKKRELAIDALQIMDISGALDESDIRAFIAGIDEGVERLMTLDLSRAF